VHGIVFTSFRHYVASRFGRDRAARLWEGRTPYLITQAYSDAEFLELFEVVRAETGVDADRLLRDFGAFAAERTFAMLYPSYFDEAGSTIAFLLSVEQRIHELVRATIPDAHPPRLVVEPLEGDGGAVRIGYASPRRLCVLLAGLVQGTARHYREQVVVEETACMHLGAAACVFDVRLTTE
jgi:hypothetical protein